MDLLIYKLFFILIWFFNTKCDICDIQNIHIIKIPFVLDINSLMVFFLH